MRDLDPEELRTHGHRVADWVADYLKTIEERPVLPDLRPGDFLAQLPAEPPRAAEPMDAILRDFEELVVPASTQWNHPGFHAYFANTASAPGILAETLTAALNANAMVWRTAPASTELEGLVLDWLRQMLGLEEAWHGHINDTASVSTLVALTAARHRATEGAVRTRGAAALANAVMYCSSETHSVVDKAAIVLGIGQDNVVKIPVDERFAMRADLLDERVRADKRAGKLPIAVTATVGTTATTAVDPVAAIAEICEREGIFLHVDAAYGGAMAIVPEERWVFEGVDRADSVCVNPHKWLYVPMDLSCLWVKDPELLRAAYSLVPHYLQTPEQGAARDLMDYGPALGRRFRALKLWFVIRAFGHEGMAEGIRQHLRLAREFEGWIAEADDWEQLAPGRMSLVLHRHRAARAENEEAIAARNQAILERINARGHSFLSHTIVGGERYALRTAIGNLRTERKHLERLWDALRAEAGAAK